MGVYIRQDSKYFWLWLPPHRVDGKPVGKGIKERTRVLATPENRDLAEKVFEARMRSAAVESHFGKPRESKLRGDLSGWTYIYFATDGELVKIGRAVNVVARLRALQTSHHRKVEVVATVLAHITVERLIHRKFAHLRTSGEWFRRSGDLDEFIDSVRSGRDIVSELVAPFSLPSLGRGGPRKG